MNAQAYRAQWHNSREVRERIFIQAMLVLETPAHFGNGDSDSVTDIPLLRDPLEGRALLSGSSIAGALRNYAREHELGYGVAEEQNGATFAEKLFGHLNLPRQEDAEEESVESWLMVDDALGESPQTELRDGVTIDARTRTAEDKKKFGVELLEAGTTFPLAFELWVAKDDGELVNTLALALRGFERGEIRLGKRKQRGYGQCRVRDWTVRRYDMTKRADVLAWLEDDAANGETGADIVKLLNATATRMDARERFTLRAHFQVEGSLLIRSSVGDFKSPDFVHLRSRRNGKAEPILAGTSAAGALRARALRIANTLELKDAEKLVGEIFGKGETKGETRQEKKPRGSRLLVRETVIENPLADRVQNRVKIDRFTGGAYPQGLFSEEPVFGLPATRVHLELELRKPSMSEVGLLLLALKDLWTADLPIGGESAVGRGRLRGEHAELEWGTERWVLHETQDGLQVDGSRQRLQDMVDALRRGDGS